MLFRSLPDVIGQPARVIAFDAQKDSQPSAKVPTALVAAAALPTGLGDLKRRRFELRVLPAMDPMTAAGGAAGMDHAHMGHGSGDHAAMNHAEMGHGATEAAGAPPRLEINGKSFAMGRIDERVQLGATEIWEIVSPEMAHPFHLHGAQFRVLTEDGAQPRLWNGGVKDTVLVENSAELLVTFTHRAGEDAPFVYHCHLLEHEDGGMMGAFTVG